MLGGFQWACQGKQCEKYGEPENRFPASILFGAIFYDPEADAVSYSAQLCSRRTHSERYKSSCSTGPGEDIGNKAEEILQVHPGVQMVWGGPQSGELK